MRKRVLIVDDHEPFRASARELLEEAGYVVAGEAGDAAEALAAVALLAADLEWSTARAPWTLGFLLEGLWVAALAALVLGFPERLPGSRSAPLAIAGALAATLGAQLAGVLVSPDPRDLLAVAP